MIQALSKRTVLTLLTTLTVAALLLILPGAVNAQSEGVERITLSPAVSRPDVKAGDTVTGKLTVINDGDVDYTFTVYARPFSFSGLEYSPNYSDVNKYTQAYKWVSFDKTSHKLKAGENTTIRYSIKLPKDATPGGHYTALFAETQPAEDGGGASIARKKRVGSLVYMRVDGEYIESGSFVDSGADWFQTEKPLSSYVSLKNDGNVHFEADIKANYTTIFGRKQFELNKKVLILPDTTRKVAVEWDNPAYFGIYKTGGEVSFLGEKQEIPQRWILLMPYPVIIVLVFAVAVLVVLPILKKKRQSGGVKQTKKRN